MAGQGFFFFFCCLARLWSEELIYTVGQNPRRKEFVKLLGRRRTLVAWVLLGYGSKGRLTGNLRPPRIATGTVVSGRATAEIGGQA